MQGSILLLWAGLHFILQHRLWRRHPGTRTYSRLLSSISLTGAMLLAIIMIAAGFVGGPPEIPTLNFGLGVVVIGETILWTAVVLNPLAHLPQWKGSKSQPPQIATGDLLVLLAAFRGVLQASSVGTDALPATPQHSVRST